MDTPEETIKRLLETPEQAKAIVFAHEFADTLIKYSNRARMLGLTVLDKAYMDMARMIKGAGELQLRTFREEGTLINQLEQSVIDRAQNGKMENMFTGKLEEQKTNEKPKRKKK